MSDICPKCGLNKELCICETLAKSDQKIVIRMVKRKFGKISTIIQGIDGKDINLRDITKHLKSKFACGGTEKEGVIELQGKHMERVKDELVRLGFAGETITLKQGIGK